MITIARLSDAPYVVTYGTVPLAAIANTERHLPDEFIAENGREITPAFRRYALPLLGESLPWFARIADIPFHST